MRNLKIFPKLFVQTFAILGILIVVVHLIVFLMFPKVYLENRKSKINIKANEVSAALQGKDEQFVEQYLTFYSRSSEIKAFIDSNSDSGEVKIGENAENSIDKSSDNNSLIIETRNIKLADGSKLSVNFVSTADMRQEAKGLIIKFLPISLAVSLAISVLVSLIYARLLTRNVQEIKEVTTRMMELDRNALLPVESSDEIGQLKAQINDLYVALLELIDDLEVKNEEIIKLEKLKFDFFRGASHELKTPLASLKIILENMKYNIGKYKDRDSYIDNCIEIVNGLAQNISQILSVSSLDHLSDDEEEMVINEILQEVLDKYELMAAQRSVLINNRLGDEKIYIGKSALKVILSNVVGNAVKYSDTGGIIDIGSDNGWIYIDNTYDDAENLDCERLFEVNFDVGKDNSNGLGLYIVRNILLSYGIEHKLERREKSIRFTIKIT
ncbi:HAMP domain-containing sensor histidine kinase [Mogibacterium neglectum]|uniref:HAMP domain-containing sensor histidine kinase n=1 Tax=Mogibacterium neglectum TaxID=114528 RepID=UPI00272D4577|nr:HAMP domain-containing sensor histidine kinase [Mogibacterium neglectum]WLD76466.1 HAMP domain-containing sensor histidine kinase [Mogibacterium neglectum]